MAPGPQCIQSKISPNVFCEEELQLIAPEASSSSKAPLPSDSSSSQYACANPRLVASFDETAGIKQSVQLFRCSIIPTDLKTSWSSLILIPGIGFISYYAKFIRDTAKGKLFEIVETFRGQKQLRFEVEVESKTGNMQVSQARMIDPVRRLESLVSAQKLIGRGQFRFEIPGTVSFTQGLTLSGGRTPLVMLEANQPPYSGDPSFFNESFPPSYADVRAVHSQIDEMTPYEGGMKYNYRVFLSNGDVLVFSTRNDHHASQAGSFHLDFLSGELHLFSEGAEEVRKVEMSGEALTTGLNPLLSLRPKSKGTFPYKEISIPFETFGKKADRDLRIQQHRIAITLTNAASSSSLAPVPSARSHRNSSISLNRGLNDHPQFNRNAGIALQLTRSSAELFLSAPPSESQLVELECEGEIAGFKVASLRIPGYIVEKGGRRKFIPRSQDPAHPGQEGFDLFAAVVREGGVGGSLQIRIEPNQGRWKFLVPSKSSSSSKPLPPLYGELIFAPRFSPLFGIATSTRTGEIQAGLQQSSEGWLATDRFKPHTLRFRFSNQDIEIKLGLPPEAHFAPEDLALLWEEALAKPGSRSFEVFSAPPTGMVPEKGALYRSGNRFVVQLGHSYFYLNLDLGHHLPSLKLEQIPASTVSSLMLVKKEEKAPPAAAQASKEVQPSSPFPGVPWDKAQTFLKKLGAIDSQAEKQINGFLAQAWQKIWGASPSAETQALLSQHHSALQDQYGAMRFAKELPESPKKALYLTLEDHGRPLKVALLRQAKHSFEDYKKCKRSLEQYALQLGKGRYLVFTLSSFEHSPGQFSFAPIEARLYENGKGDTPLTWESKEGYFVFRDPFPSPGSQHSLLHFSISSLALARLDQHGFLATEANFGFPHFVNSAASSAAGPQLSPSESRNENARTIPVLHWNQREKKESWQNAVLELLPAQKGDLKEVKTFSMRLGLQTLRFKVTGKFILGRDGKTHHWRWNIQSAALEAAAQATPFKIPHTVHSTYGWLEFAIPGQGKLIVPPDLLYALSPFEGALLKGDSLPTGFKAQITWADSETPDEEIANSIRGKEDSPLDLYKGKTVQNIQSIHSHPPEIQDLLPRLRRFAQEVAQGYPLATFPGTTSAALAIYSETLESKLPLSHPNPLQPEQIVFQRKGEVSYLTQNHCKLAVGLYTLELGKNRRVEFVLKEIHRIGPHHSHFSTFSFLPLEARLIEGQSSTLLDSVGAGGASLVFENRSKGFKIALPLGHLLQIQGLESRHSPGSVELEDEPKNYEDFLARIGLGPEERVSLRTPDQLANAISAKLVLLNDRSSLCREIKLLLSHFKHHPSLATHASEALLELIKTRFSEKQEKRAMPLADITLDILAKSHADEKRSREILEAFRKLDQELKRERERKKEEERKGI